VDPLRPLTPEHALRRLLAGNRRFVAGRQHHPRQSVTHLRRLADGQRPYAVILGCADSRVPPELLFDQGLGDLFGHRVAGNIVNDLLLGSIEYAMAEFGPAVILVLGHERCGAVTATIDVLRGHEPPDGHVGGLIDRLRPVVAPVLDGPGDVVDAAVRANIRAQVAAVRRGSPLVRRELAAGRVRLVGGRYDLDSGRVTLVG
jgi:carbonic anhydrase